MAPSLGTVPKTWGHASRVHGAREEMQTSGRKPRRGAPVAATTGGARSHDAMAGDGWQRAVAQEVPSRPGNASCREPAAVDRLAVTPGFKELN
jgi:hypothetical protein